MSERADMLGVMRMKLTAIAGVALLLAGCSSATPEPTVETPSPESATSEWDALTFCDTLAAERENYQVTLNGDTIDVSELAEFKSWADALKAKADAETATDVAQFTAPIYVTDSQTVDLLAVFGAANNLGGYCVLNG